MYTPATVKNVQTTNTTLYGFHHCIRSSSVDFDHFFFEQGCIGPSDLRLICKYRHDLYLIMYSCIGPTNLHYKFDIS